MAPISSAVRAQRRTNPYRDHNRGQSRFFNREPAAEELGCFHRWSLKVVNKHISLYLSAAPQHAVVDNSEMFFRLERVMIKTIDVVSTIPTPLTLQERKIVSDIIYSSVN